MLFRSQAYCSALPVEYCSHPEGLWESFARLILEASYEATICAAILNSRRTGNNRVFLTFLGGGAFGNPDSWITAAIERSLRLYRGFDLNVGLVSYAHSRPKAQKIVDAFSG